MAAPLENIGMNKLVQTMLISTSDLSDYGLSHDFCMRENFYIFFGLDWIEKKEEEIILAEIGIQPDLVLEVFDKKIFGSFVVENIDQAIEMESEILTKDKIISFSDRAIIFITDDRDVYYICADKSIIQGISKKVARLTHSSVSDSFHARDSWTSKPAGNYYRYWQDRMVNAE